MATQLHKSAGEHDVKVVGIEVEVAWTLITSLMSLGPNFVRPHLPQLRIYGEMLFPNRRPRIRQVTLDGQVLSVLLHVQESALGAIWSFLQHNLSTLVTLDVARQIASLLSNALSFANNFISQNIEDLSDAQLPTAVKKGLTVRD